jgi:hypothetical protein
LPEILIAAFRDRDVEALGDPCLDALQNSAFALQRMIFRDRQLQLQNPHDHGKFRADVDAGRTTRRLDARFAPRLRRRDASDHRDSFKGLEHITLLEILKPFEG